MLKSVQLNNIDLEVRNFNGDFILLSLLSNKNAVGLCLFGKAILDKNFDFIEEVIATETEIYLKLNKLFNPNKLEQIKDIEIPSAVQSAEIKIPIYFEVEGDWKTIENISGINKQQYIEKLLKLDFTIAMFGFLPGFVYMNGLPKNMQIPRKATAAKYIPKNSLAIGNQYMGIYSLNSPGGWNVIGQLPISILDFDSLPAICLQPSDKIKFDQIDYASYSLLKNKSISIKEYNG